MSAYSLRLRDHLSRYKESVLAVTEQVTREYRGRSISYRHILPHAKRHLNVLDGFREEFWTYWDRQRLIDRPPAALHSMFAHLTSSQALAFNLFFPFLGSTHANPDTLLIALGIRPQPIKSWRFEAVLNSDEGTNCDVAIQFESGKRLLVEVKLAEPAFGTCRDDERHRCKLRDIYAPKLTGIVVNEALEATAFFRRYQILRNLSYVDSHTHLVFLLPKENEALADGVKFIGEVIHGSQRHRVSVRFLEDVVVALAGATAGTKLGDHTRAFAVKYHIRLDPQTATR